MRESTPASAPAHSVAMSALGAMIKSGQSSAKTPHPLPNMLKKTQNKSGSICAVRLSCLKSVIGSTLSSSTPQSKRGNAHQSQVHRVINGRGDSCEGTVFCDEVSDIRARCDKLNSHFFKNLFNANGTHACVIRAGRFAVIRGCSRLAQAVQGCRAERSADDDDRETTCSNSGGP